MSLSEAGLLGLHIGQVDLEQLGLRVGGRLLAKDEGSGRARDEALQVLDLALNEHVLRAEDGLESVLDLGFLVAVLDNGQEDLAAVEREVEAEFRYSIRVLPTVGR